MKKKLASKQIPVAAIFSNSSPYYFWLILAVLLCAYLVDFYFDIRSRDCFTWMDPGEYYQYATSLVGGFQDSGQFNVPTIFPILITPFLLIGGASIPSALWVNIFFVIVLCVAIRKLCRQFDITNSSFLIIAATLSSPLMIGLSRELYIEFALTAVGAWIFSLYNDDRRQTSHWRTVLFGVLFGFGFMMKTTFPIFFVGPFIVTAIWLLKSREYSKLMREMLVFSVPVILVLGLMYFFFRQTFGYYLRFANTAIPVTKLVGPGPVFSMASNLYYITEIWSSMLFLLAPLLLVTIPFKEARAALTDRKALILWSWLGGPLLFLTLVEHKEPRHFAPCIVPIALLLFRAVSAIQWPKVKKAVCSVALLACLAQYLLITNHIAVAPYFLDEPSHSTKILEAMKAADPNWKRDQDGNESFREFCWLRTKNVALTGFDPNMALSLAWSLRPAIVFDLDLLNEKHAITNDVSLRHFEDLFYYSASSIYNRRCLCRNYYPTLDSDHVLANADYLLVSLGQNNRDGISVPGFHSIVTLGQKMPLVQVLVANRPSTNSYRAIYDHEFLRSEGRLKTQDTAAVYFDLAIDASLRGDFLRLNKLFAEYPLDNLLNDDSPKVMRNIYWMADDIQLKQFMVQYLRAYSDQKRRAGGKKN